VERLKSFDISNTAHNRSNKMTHHPNSLANLKLGAESRRSGKVRHHYTIKPENHAWLASGGNASLRLDEVISKILGNELLGYQHIRKAEAEIARLRKENEELRKALADMETRQQ